jgi:hypothetical protein
MASRCMRCYPLSDPRPAQLGASHGLDRDDTISRSPIEVALKVAVAVSGLSIITLVSKL